MDVRSSHVERPNFAFTKGFSFYNPFLKTGPLKIDDLVLTIPPFNSTLNEDDLKKEKKGFFISSLFIEYYTMQDPRCKISSMHQMAENITRLLSSKMFDENQCNDLDLLQYNIQLLVEKRIADFAQKSIIAASQQRLVVNQRVVEELAQLGRGGNSAQPQPLKWEEFFSCFHDKLQKQNILLGKIQGIETRGLISSLRESIEQNYQVADYPALRKKIGSFQPVFEAHKKEISFLNKVLESLIPMAHERLMLVYNKFKKNMFFLGFNYEAAEKFEREYTTLESKYGRGITGLSKEEGEKQKEYSKQKRVYERVDDFASEQLEYPCFVANLMTEKGTPLLEIGSIDEFKQMVSIYTHYFQVIEDVIKFFIKQRSDLFNLERDVLFSILVNNEDILVQAFSQNKDLRDELIKKNRSRLPKFAKDYDMSVEELTSDNIPLKLLLLDDDEILKNFLMAPIE